MRIGVTGGCGYLGSVLIPKLIELGHTVEALDLRPPEIGLLNKTDPKRFRYQNADISVAGIADNVLGNFDAIIHLAALVGYPACEKDPGLAERWNLVSTRNVMRFKKKNAPVIFSSTISNYGPQTSRVDEESTANPNSVYGVTKKAAEDLVLAERTNIVYRFAGAFGVSPKMRHDNLIHDFVLQSMSGKSLSVYESHFVRQFIHVRDMADALIFALDNWEKMQGNIFNIGNPNIEITKKQLVERLAKHHKFLYRFENSGADLEKRDYPISFEKMSKVGFRPTVGLDEGITELLAHYQNEQRAKEFANAR